MTVTNAQSGTNVHEIAAGIYRISTPAPPGAVPGGFTFNQILVVDDEPLLFHTGLRRMFPLVREAVAHVLGDAAKLGWVGFSHFESDESGALNEWLAAAPRAQAVCGQVAAMVSVNDYADRPPRALADGEELSLGSKRVRWLDAPHVRRAPLVPRGARRGRGRDDPRDDERQRARHPAPRRRGPPPLPRRPRRGGARMTCARPATWETLVAYWAGELGAAEEDALEVHLMACDACPPSRRASPRSPRRSAR